MPFYFACTPLEYTDYLKGLGLEVLCSFHSWKNMDVMPNSPYIIDSGAFSIWNSGANININDYIHFLKRRQNVLAFNFDSIGDAKQTYQNQKIIEDAGLDVIPCFHLGSKYKYLKQYIDEGYEYIALGGLARKARYKLKAEFFRKCFKLGANNKIKFHGFGISHQYCNEFPFYSIDSISWLIYGVFGSFLKEGKNIPLSLSYTSNNRVLIASRQALHLNYLYKRTVREHSMLYYNYFKDEGMINEILGMKSLDGGG